MNSAILQRPLYVNLVYGPVKAGKSSELVNIILSLIRGGHIDDNMIEVFKHPLSDKMYKNEIHAAGGNSFPAKEATTADEIFDELKKNPEAKYIFIDGANFYDNNIVKLVEALRDSKRFITLGGLNLDSDAEPFGPMDQLMTLAQNYVKKSASSQLSGEEADLSLNKNGEYMPVSRQEYFGFKDGKRPRVKAIVGPMYSSKTESLLEEIDKLKWLKSKHPKDDSYDFDIFKSYIDTRYKKDEITSHNQRSEPCRVIRNGEELEDILKDEPFKKNIVIDEAQFIPGISDVIKKYYSKGYSFIISALKRDYKGEPFNKDIGRILCLADDIINRTGFCSYPGCSNIATETQRFINIDGERLASSYDEPQIQQGAQEAYTTRCSEHHIVRGKEEHNNYSEIKYIVR